MFLYDIARKINAQRKIQKKINAGRYLSPVRRIEKTAPLTSGKYIAMTFDDGPSAAPPDPLPLNVDKDSKLTEVLLNILNNYNAKGTFDVIGTTEFNYPDHKGKPDAFSWGGVRYDHYPDFGQDKLAGVKNQIELARKIVNDGHELANHGYRHILFGPMKLVYGTREYYKALHEVVNDLNTLHELVQNELKYQIKLSRPPHYVDAIPGGFSAYDAYRCMNYQYLAASFDGGGWKPSCGDYEKDVQHMQKPLEEAIAKNPEVLNGQIIFQKDGYNMSRQTPVADALDRALKTLVNAGYKIVTVSELLAMSPFEDINDTDPIFEAVKKLARAGYCIGYKNNTFQPDRILTIGELAVMTIPPEIHHKLFVEAVNNKNRKKDTAFRHPYQLAMEWFSNKGYITNINKILEPDKPVTAEQFSLFLNNYSEGKDVKWSFSGQKTSKLKRRDAVEALADIAIRT